MFLRVVVGFWRRHRGLAVVVVSEHPRTATCTVVGRGFVDVRIALKSAAVKAVDRLITAQLHTSSKQDVQERLAGLLIIFYVLKNQKQQEQALVALLSNLRWQRRTCTPSLVHWTWIAACTSTKLNNILEYIVNFLSYLISTHGARNK